jgi:hypothetical protein
VGSYRRWWSGFFSGKLWFLGLAFWILPGTSHATSLASSDVLTRARIYLRDQSTGANRQQFTDATLLQFLSDGQREANAQNWLIVSSTTFNLTLGTTEYAMPTDFMATLRVWFQPSGGSYIKLDQTSFDQMDAQSSGWISATGPPTKYYLDRSRANTNLAFWPAPSVTSSTGPVIVYYVQQTPDCTVTSCVPFNGDVVLQPYVSALAYYVAYRGFLSVEETDLANAYLQYWVSFLQIMRQGTTKMPDFTPGFVGGRSP